MGNKKELDRPACFDVSAEDVTSALAKLKACRNCHTLCSFPEDFGVSESDKNECLHCINKRYERTCSECMFEWRTEKPYDWNAKCVRCEKFKNNEVVQYILGRMSASSRRNGLY